MWSLLKWNRNKQLSKLNFEIALSLLNIRGEYSNITSFIQMRYAREKSKDMLKAFISVLKDPSNVHALNELVKTCEKEHRMLWVLALDKIMESPSMKRT